MAWSSGGWGEVPWGGGANTDHLVIEAAVAQDRVSTQLDAQARVTEFGVNFDVVSANVDVDALVREQAAGIDRVTATQVLTTGVVEAAAGSDSAAAQIIAQGIIVEAAAGIDLTAAAFAVNADIAEGALLSDRYTTAEFYEFLCLERAGAKDTPTNTMDLLPMHVIERAAGTDMVSPTMTMDSEVIEAGTIRDIAGARYRWEPVNDGQGGTWVPVIDTQPGPWTPVL